jgi:outer membrane protein TolC
MRRVATVCILASVLAGCTTLGPDYVEPEVTWLKSWQSDLYGELGDANRQTNVDLHFWWEAFNDPVLNRLIETARRENPSLRIAGLRKIGIA